MVKNNPPLHIETPFEDSSNMNNSLRPSDAYTRQQTNHHWLRQWLVAWPPPSHCLNQCWNTVDWTFRKNLQWNLDWNSYIFIQEMHLKMSSGKCRPFCLGLNVLRRAYCGVQSCPLPWLLGDVVLTWVQEISNLAAMKWQPWMSYLNAVWVLTRLWYYGHMTKWLSSVCR